MTREYFYTPPALIGRDELSIEGDEFTHLTHVMRKMPGDAVCVVNGVGTAYDVTIIDISRHTARCRITATHHRLNEPDIDLTLAVAILKNSSRFDFLVEKATELGVTTIVPLLTERTIPRHAKRERWMKLAVAAMKQSERCVLPAIVELTDFRTFIGTTSRSGVLLIPHERTEAPLAAELRRHPSQHHITIAIGPEGGFAGEEITEAKAAGFTPVGLGARRLRTETAAVLASALALSSA